MDHKELTIVEELTEEEMVLVVAGGTGLINPGGQIKLDPALVREFQANGLPNDKWSFFTY